MCMRVPHNFAAHGGEETSLDTSSPTCDQTRMLGTIYRSRRRYSHGKHYLHVRLNDGIDPYLSAMYHGGASRSGHEPNSRQRGV